ncbi:MAG: DMT family transporter [Alphaproteobacteria bacterium]|nr:MAG: DMT family transporter [Alphaproteobacteria bacterium]
METTISPDKTGQGIITILFSVLLMAFTDALVKLLSSDLTIWQIFFARALFAIPLMLLTLRLGRSRFALQSLHWVVLRSLLLILTWLAFYAALPVLSLSVAAVAVYTNPIITALLSALVIGEPVTKRQWGGVLLGFLGVVAILRPGSDAFSWITLLPLLAAACYSGAMVLTRHKCREETPITLAIGLQAAFFITGFIGTGVLALLHLSPETIEIFPFLLNDWQEMGGGGWGLMALLGTLSAIYFVGVARAYQIAAPSIIATFDYGYLVFAAVWGFVFFGEAPDRLTLCGMLLITCAGLLVAIRPAKAE